MDHVACISYTMVDNYPSQRVSIFVTESGNIGKIFFPIGRISYFVLEVDLVEAREPHLLIILPLFILQ